MNPIFSEMYKNMTYLGGLMITLALAGHPHQYQPVKTSVITVQIGASNFITTTPVTENLTQEAHFSQNKISRFILTPRRIPGTLLQTYPPKHVKSTTKSQILIQTTPSPKATRPTTTKPPVTLLYKPTSKIPTTTVKPIQTQPSTESLNHHTNAVGDQCGLANRIRSLPQNYQRFHSNPWILNNKMPKIVGGKAAKFGAWPWIASLRRTSVFSNSSTHFCGGALISRNWIATAAHCVASKSLSGLLVRLRELNFRDHNLDFPFLETKIEKIIIHPDYKSIKLENDMALLKLKSSVQFSHYISPICLPTSNNDFLVGRNASVIGWGKLSSMGKRPQTLQEVYVPIISNDECMKMFNDSGIPNTFLCAGYPEGGRDACQGDSGGPLQVLGSDNKWFLAGITSWGHGCGNKNSPGVYTRISQFSEWISQKMIE